MAGRRKAQAPVLPSTSLVASAVRYPAEVARVYVGAKEWQRECYRHYGICGEARYAANYYGRAMGKAVLYAVEDTSPDAKRLENGKAVDAMESLFNGSEGQEAMLTSIGIHLEVAGEAYLIGREVPVVDPDSGEVTGETDELWEILSVLEVHKAGNQWSITSKEEGEMDIVLDKDAVIIRIWRPDPKRRLEADSPFKSLLPVLREIEYLTLRIFAECQSRLTGAGLMFVSQDVTFPEPPKEIDGRKITVNNQAEGLLWTLAEAMVTATEDPGSPAALAPIMATVPSEVWQNGGKVAEMFHFWTDLDENALGMRNGALLRFAQGMDMPPEKVLGISSNPGTAGGRSSGVSHWGAWQIDEDFIKLHIEPDLSLVCNALVIGFLRPFTGGMEALRYDTQKLRLRPDRSKEAQELYRLGLLKGDVVVRENGFNPETDMMTDEDRHKWLLVMVATGTAPTTPEQVGAALLELGVDLGTPAEVHNVPEDKSRPPDNLPERDAGPHVRNPKPLPSLEGHPTRREPDMPSAASLLLAVCEPLVLTALNRAGNKLRQKGKGGVQPTGIAAYEVHTVIAANGLTDLCLDDAFPHASMCLNGVAPAETVVPVLDAYVRTLLANQRPHTRELLAKALESVT